jgi:hypothetical protein
VLWPCATKVKCPLKAQLGKLCADAGLQRLRGRSGVGCVRGARGAQHGEARGATHMHNAAHEGRTPMVCVCYATICRCCSQEWQRACLEPFTALT